KECILRAVNLMIEDIKNREHICIGYSAYDKLFVVHPLITPIGLRRATFFEIPALCTTFTTLDTSLYASGISSASVSLPDDFTITPLSANSLQMARPFACLMA